jgi:thioredoxin-like negative regulator of GroEL
MATTWPVSARWNEGARGYREAQREQERSRAPMVVYFFTDWCPHCREFERELLYHWEVERHLRNRVVKVRVNPENGPEDHALAGRFGVTGFPSFYLTAPGVSPRKLSRSGAEQNLASPREFIETIERAASRMAKDRIHEGWSLRSRGDLEGSLAAFELALAIGPKNPEAYYQRAFAHLDAGSLEAAFEDFGAALALNPEQVDVFAHAGHALTQRQRWDESVACWTKAIEAKPSDAPAHIGRARAHDGRGDRVRAREDLATACRLGDRRSCSIADQLDTPG